MLIGSGKDDLRIQKTFKLLNAAMFSLLEHNNFGKITVRDICDKSQISRATFYSHFDDKFDFLKKWLANIGVGIATKCEGDVNQSEIINDYIYKNKCVIKNLLFDASPETLRILAEFLHSLLFANSAEGDDKSIKNLVLSNFFCGGLLYYFFWQAQNKFPTNIVLVNDHISDIVKTFRELEAKSE